MPDSSLGKCVKDWDFLFARILPLARASYVSD